MKALGLLLVATLFTSVAVLGQGEFIFDNRAGFVDVNARFVLATDPPGTSSVGTNFRVDLFGGPEGTPVTQLVPLRPASTGFRGPAGSAAAGYVIGIPVWVPGGDLATYATVLIRVYDSPAWETATYRFERLYPRVLLGGDPVMAPVLLMGNDPLVLLPVPEPKSVVLVLVALGALACRFRRKISATLTLGLLAASLEVHGQGEFYFNNRVGSEVDARFVLSTDPPGTSSVGEGFQVQLFGGPEGTPVNQLLPLEPPSTEMRGPAGTVTAGYVVAFQAAVPGVFPGSTATVLVRTFDGTSWDAATYRYEGVYSVALGNWNVPGTVWLGTSPLVLQPIPEPSTFLLALLALGALVRLMRRRVGLMVMIVIVAGSAANHGQGWFGFNNRIVNEVDARFVLPTDPPGTSSVGTGFQVQLFGGPEGTPLSQLVPLDPPSTRFRGLAGTGTAGYAVGVSGIVPGVQINSPATVLVRVFDGPSWGTANYRFEQDYTVLLGKWDIPGFLPLGTSPLVLQPIPEPSTILLVLLGLSALACRFRRKISATLTLGLLAASLEVHG